MSYLHTIHQLKYVIVYDVNVVMVVMLQLLSALRTRSFELDGVSYKFNKDGDINLGYDVSLWNTDGASVETLNVVSYYQPSDSGLNSDTLMLVCTHTVTCLSLCLSILFILLSLCV